MRILVISDIHSNYAALIAVLEAAQPFDSILFAGDIVGFGPHPNECVDLIRGLGATCVKGNHDHAIVIDDYSTFPTEVAIGDSMSRKILSPSNLDWVSKRKLTETIMVEGVSVRLLHANPVNPLSGYVQKHEAYDRLNEFKDLVGTDLLIMGHTHRPYIHRTSDFTLLNPGSVGLPRDIAQSSFMVLDLNEGEIEIAHTRVDYDYDANADAMAELGLPEKYVKRMKNGPG